jgi:hypothetical protein
MAIAIEPSKITVKLFGAKHSPTAYAIRDFLQRSVVAFEWIELQSDEEARTLAQVENLRDRRLPICVFSDGAPGISANRYNFTRLVDVDGAGRKRTIQDGSHFAYISPWVANRIV